MANIKQLALISDKWIRRASVAGADYEAGVRNPRTSWVDSAVAAESNYKTAVVAAANAGKFGKGVRKAGETTWKDNAIAKGPARFSEGVSLAKPNFEKGFAPFRQTIESLTLPPRGPKGSPANLARVAAVATALRKTSEGLTA